MSDEKQPASRPAPPSTEMIGSAPPPLPPENRPVWATSPMTQELPGLQDNWRVTVGNLRFVNRFNVEAAYRYVGRMIALEQERPGRLAGLIRAVTEASVDRGLLTLQILDELHFSRLVRFQSDIHQALTDIVLHLPDDKGAPVRAKAFDILSHDRSRQTEFRDLVREQLTHGTESRILSLAARWAARQFVQGGITRDELEELRTLTGRRLTSPSSNTAGLQQAFLHLHETAPVPAPASPKTLYMIQAWLLSTQSAAALVRWAENTTKISRDGFWNDFTWETFIQRLSQERDPNIRAALWNGIGYLSAARPPGTLEAQFLQLLTEGKLDHEPNLPQLVSRILGTEQGKPLGSDYGLPSKPFQPPPAQMQHFRQRAWDYLLNRLVRDFSPEVHASLRVLEPVVAGPERRPLISELMERLTVTTVSPSALIQFYRAERHRLGDQHRIDALETIMTAHYRRWGAADPQPLSPEEVTLFRDILADLPRRKMVAWLINRSGNTPLFRQHVHLLLHRLANPPDTHPPDAQTPSRYLTTQLLASLPPQEADAILKQYPQLNHAPQPVSLTRQLKVTFVQPLTDYIQARQPGQSRVYYEDNLEQDAEVFVRTRTTPAVSPRYHFLAAWFATLEKANQEPLRYLLHLMHATHSMPIDDLQSALLDRASTIPNWHPVIRQHLAGFLQDVARKSTGERAILAGHLTAIMEGTPGPQPTPPTVDSHAGTTRRMPGPGRKYGLDH